MAKRYNRRLATKRLESIADWLNGHRQANRASSTGEMNYSAEQVEFMQAMYELKKRLGRMPTCGEILSEAKRLGYERQ